MFYPVVNPESIFFDVIMKKRRIVEIHSMRRSSGHAGTCFNCLFRKEPESIQCSMFGKETREGFANLMSSVYSRMIGIRPKRKPIRRDDAHGARHAEHPSIGLRSCFVRRRLERRCLCSAMAEAEPNYPIAPLAAVSRRIRTVAAPVRRPPAELFVAPASPSAKPPVGTGWGPGIEGFEGCS